MLTDFQIERKIKTLQRHIMQWAIKYDVWEGCRFESYLEYFDDEPSKDIPCLTILEAGDNLIRLLADGYSSITDKLDELAHRQSCSYEYDGELLIFTYIEDTFLKDFANYFEWKWITSLVKPDYSDLHHELFTYFNQAPERLSSLSPRDFEIFISELLRQNGYKVTLGPGWNDGGVDMILQNMNSIDPQVTLVQVKRYHSRYAIRLEAVAALLGVVHHRKADKGLFITSSRFLDSAKTFARKSEKPLELADGTDIKNWNFNASKEIDQNIKKYLTIDYIAGLFTYEGNIVGNILVSDTSSKLIDNQSSEFFIILRDTPHICLIMQLPKKRCFDGGFYTVGNEMPILDFTLYFERPTSEIVFRVKKKYGTDGTVRFLGQRRVYFLWDNLPRSYIIN